MKTSATRAKVSCAETGPCARDALTSSAGRFQMAIWFVSPAMESAPLRSEAALDLTLTVSVDVKPHVY